MSIETVVKVGGGVLRDAAAFGAVVSALGAAAGRPVLVVPGGGPFADAVRDAAATFALDDSTAHWMAIAAMDQYGMMLASRIARARVVTDADEAGAALESGALPILVPLRWLRRADPLPHGWDVTSDSIAAWVAGQVGAARLVLIKPSGAAGSLVDPYFERAAGSTLDSVVVTADQTERLSMLLGSDGVPT